MNVKCVLCDAQINNEKDSFVIAQLYVRGKFRKSYYACSECIKRFISSENLEKIIFEHKSIVSVICGDLLISETL